MRVLFTVLGERSMFESMVPLAWALRTAGHEVRVACQPDLVDHVTWSGLSAVPVGRDHVLWKLVNRRPRLRDDVREDQFPPFDKGDAPVGELTLGHLQAGYDTMVPWMFRPVNEAIIEDLVAFSRAWRPDLVMWEPRTFAGAVAAETVGALHARMLWGVDYFARLRGHYLRLAAERPEEAGPDALADWLSRVAERHGVAFDETMTHGHFTIDQLPPSLRLDVEGPDYLSMRYVPYNGRSVTPPWLWAPPERPRVCLTLGVSAMGRAYGYSVSAGELVESLAELDAEIVATVAEKEQDALGTLPDNVRVESFVPLHALLPHCDAVVHHGGFGSTNTALIEGVPQLVLAQQFDAPAKARLIDEQGAGLRIPTAETTGPLVRDGVRRLLSEPGFARNAGRLRQEVLDQPTPNGLVEELERRVALHGGGSAAAPAAASGVPGDTAAIR
ncbi:glycosyl transferase [Nocardiopsis terrae]|uniref:Glycosyltransferase (Activator-dependent family) n=1 Tax=Nocardiopsis terrae TaxID=372655 RepID=A0ABR9HA87_9ACTN|nr:activator-dependent family glycosyltransferase [Nocardiopsis terrae]MBE1455961.1 glycosyltransferase (activator-dependent family) [Nocardiopsis terrae]GHC96489.1 glycosyl transferase [Nocardiopsis terrae]